MLIHWVSKPLRCLNKCVGGPVSGWRARGEHSKLDLSPAQHHQFCFVCFLFFFCNVFDEVQFSGYFMYLNHCLVPWEGCVLWLWAFLDPVKKFWLFTVPRATVVGHSSCVVVFLHLLVLFSLKCCFCDIISGHSALCLRRYIIFLSMIAKQSGPESSRY